MGSALAVKQLLEKFRYIIVYALNRLHRITVLGQPIPTNDLLTLHTAVHMKPEQACNRHLGLGREYISQDYFLV